MLKIRSLFKKETLKDDAVAGPFRCAAHLRVKGTDDLRDELLGLLGPSTKIRIGAKL